MDVYTFLILECLALFFLILAYKKYKKWQEVAAEEYSIYDRENGEVVLPNLLRTNYFKIKFNKLAAIKDRTIGSVAQAALPYSILFFLEGKKAITHKEELFDATLFEPREFDAKESWYFYVWYMDKNRPLPPGEIFDAYRDKDYQRRKAEGFPPPLYKSVAPTPENTPEQQLVREAFWKDEDYLESIS